MQFSIKRDSKDYSHKFTDDFQAMIRIVIWNSLGFFFIEFIMIYFANQVLGATGTQLGLFYSLLTIGSMISAFVVGSLTDYYSRRNLVLIGSFGRGISYFGLYFSIIYTSLFGMYLSGFALGFGAGFFWVPFDSLVSDKSSKHHRSSAFAQRRFAMGIGMVGGAVLGLLIFGFANVFIPTNPFIIYGSIPLFGIGNFYAGIKFAKNVDENSKFKDKENIQESEDLTSEEGFLENQNIEELPEKTPMRFLFGLGLLFMALFFSSMNGGIAKPFIQPYILENIENNPTLVAWIFLPTSLVGTLIAPKLGNAADKVNIFFAITFASIMGSIITFFVIISTELWIFAVLLIIDNTVMMFTSFALINFLSRVSVKHRGKIFGSLTTLQNLGFAIGPIIGGFFWDTVAQTAPFVISIIVELILVPFFMMGIAVIKPYIAEKIEEAEKSIPKKESPLEEAAI